MLQARPRNSLAMFLDAATAAVGATGRSGTLLVSNDGGILQVRQRYFPATFLDVATAVANVT